MKWDLLLMLIFCGVGRVNAFSMSGVFKGVLTDCCVYRPIKVCVRSNHCSELIVSRSTGFQINDMNFQIGELQ